MAGSVKYCPVQGLFLNCDNCKTLQCMDFFLYVIEDAKTDEEVRIILTTLKKLLVNQTKTTIVLDSFSSKLINAIKDDYDYIIAQSMQGSRTDAALNVLLRQQKRGILVIDKIVSEPELNNNIKSHLGLRKEADHINSKSAIIIKFITST